MLHKLLPHFCICVFLFVSAFLLSACLDEGVSPRPIRGDAKYDIEESSSSVKSSSSLASSSSPLDMSMSSSLAIPQPSEPRYILDFISDGYRFYNITNVPNFNSGMTTDTTKFTRSLFMIENENTPCGHYVKDCEDTLGVCYGNDEENCVKFGRLYTWTEAMALPDSCDSVYCDPLVNASKAQGICPHGFHIMETWEWGTLKMMNTRIEDSGFGANLKSATMWNGDDNLGFNALPGGYADEKGEFFGLGEETYFWLSKNIDTGYGTDDETQMHVVQLTTESNDLIRHRGFTLPKKARAYVRCVKNL